MREPQNIRPALFLDMKIEVGKIQSHLYAKGITKGNLKDGWWTLLTPLQNGLYQVRLPGGKPLVGQLVYVLVE